MGSRMGSVDQPVRHAAADEHEGGGQEVRLDLAETAQAVERRRQDGDLEDAADEGGEHVPGDRDAHQVGQVVVGGVEQESAGFRHHARR